MAVVKNDSQFVLAFVPAPLAGALKRVAR